MPSITAKYSTTLLILLELIITPVELQLQHMRVEVLDKEGFLLHNVLHDGIEVWGVGGNHLGGLSLMHEEVDAEEDRGVLPDGLLL